MEQGYMRFCFPGLIYNIIIKLRLFPNVETYFLIYGIFLNIYNCIKQSLNFGRYAIGVAYLPIVSNTCFNHKVKWYDQFTHLNKVTLVLKMVNMYEVVNFRSESKTSGRNKYLLLPWYSFTWYYRGQRNIFLHLY